MKDAIVRSATPSLPLLRVAASLLKRHTLGDGEDQTPFHEKVVKLNIEIYFANFIFGAGLGLVSHWPEVH